MQANRQRFNTMPEQYVMDTLDKMLSGEISLDEQSYRLVVLAELRANRQKQMAILEKIDGNGHPGLGQRVKDLETAMGIVPADLMDMVLWWRQVERRNQWLGQPLTIALVLGLLGLLWGLLTGHVRLTP